MAHELPTLPYPYDALDPHIDGRTMEIRHGKHHAAWNTQLLLELIEYHAILRLLGLAFAYACEAHPRGKILLECLREFRLPTIELDNAIIGRQSEKCPGDDFLTDTYRPCLVAQCIEPRVERCGVHGVTDHAQQEECKARDRVLFPQHATCETREMP